MSTSIDNIKTRFEAFIKESYPDVDISPGSVISELLVKLSASVNDTISTDITNINATSSLQLALDSTVDTYSEVIDKIASNYNSVRNTGKKSSGKLKVYVARDRVYQTKAGLSFYQPALDLTYVTTSDYIISTTPAIGELQLYKLDSQYFFLLPIQAENAGAEYQVSNKTKFELSSGLSYTDFVSAEAYGNFTTGLPVETDKELITRMKNGLYTRGLMSSNSILANLSERSLQVEGISVIGAHDDEMTRSKQNGFAISTLGMADVYVRTSRGPETITFTTTAKKVSTGVWSLELTNSPVGGFYKIVSILPINNNLVGSLEITSETYGYSTQGFDRANTINNANEARFTKYQTCSVVFSYGETPALNVDDTITVEVTVTYQPNINEIQDIFLSDAERIACADYLVKAVNPCFISLNLRLYKKNTTDVIPISKVKQDIFNYINTIPFKEDLYVSKIIDICHNYSIKRVDLPVNIIGDILTPYGTVITINNNDILEIPTNLSQGISKNNTQFFIDYYSSDGSTNNLVDNIGIEII